MKVSDIDYKEGVSNIRTILSMATPKEIVDGYFWYADAQKDCFSISTKFDIPNHISVGVVSALSPNNKWDRNVINARDMVRAYINGDSIDSFKVSTYHKMKEKAWKILQDSPFYDEVKPILNGQKITTFYECIMGENTCCVDGHARNIFYLDRQGLTTPNTSIGKKEYEIIQNAYREVADTFKVDDYPNFKLLGKDTLGILTNIHNDINSRSPIRFKNFMFKAYHIQAITWLTWRRIYGIT